MTIIILIGLGCCLGFVLRIGKHGQTPTHPQATKQTKQTKPAKHIDIDAIREELTFLEIRCQNLIELLDCIDLIYGKSKDTKKQAQLIRKRITIDQQYHNAMKKRYKLERILNEYDKQY